MQQITPELSMVTALSIIPKAKELTPKLTSHLLAFPCWRKLPNANIASVVFIAYIEKLGFGDPFAYYCNTIQSLFTAKCDDKPCIQKFLTKIKTLANTKVSERVNIIEKMLFNAEMVKELAAYATYLLQYSSIIEASTKLGVCSAVTEIESLAVSKHNASGWQELHFATSNGSIYSEYTKFEACITHQDLFSLHNVMQTDSIKKIEGAYEYFTTGMDYTQYNNLDAISNQLNAIMVNKDTNVNSLKNQISSLTQQVCELANKHKDALVIIEEYKGNDGKNKAMIAELSNRLNLLTTANAECQIKQNQLNMQIKSLETLAQGSKNNHQEEHNRYENYVNQLKNEIKGKTELQEASSNKLKDATDQINILHAKIKAIENEHSQKDTLIANLQKQIHDRDIADAQDKEQLANERKTTFELKLQYGEMMLEYENLKADMIDKLGSSKVIFKEVCDKCLTKNLCRTLIDGHKFCQVCLVNMTDDVIKKGNKQLYCPKCLNKLHDDDLPTICKFFTVSDNVNIIFQSSKVKHIHKM